MYVVILIGFASWSLQNQERKHFGNQEISQ